MAETKKIKHGSHKAAFPIGLIVVILAAIGVAAIVVGAVKGISGAVAESRSYDEYNTLLTPVVLIDPDPFDDVTNADMNQLIEISIWSLLKSDISPDKYTSTESGLSIPKADVEAQFKKLFGTEITPVHATVEGYGYEFTYDDVAGTYTVPLTGIVPIYTPEVVDKSTSSGTVVLTVACLAGDAWEQGENGEMVKPAPDKYIKVTLREKDSSMYISAIQNTSAPETATTQETQSETQNADLLEQAEQVASEASSESTAAASESSSGETASAESQSEE